MDDHRALGLADGRDRGSQRARLVLQHLDVHVAERRGHVVPRPDALVEPCLPRRIVLPEERHGHHLDVRRQVRLAGLLAREAEVDDAAHAEAVRRLPPRLCEPPDVVRPHHHPGTGAGPTPGGKLPQVANVDTPLPAKCTRAHGAQSAPR